MPGLWEWDARKPIFAVKLRLRLSTKLHRVNLLKTFAEITQFLILQGYIKCRYSILLWSWISMSFHYYLQNTNLPGQYLLHYSPDKMKIWRYDGVFRCVDHLLGISNSGYMWDVSKIGASTVRVQPRLIIQFPTESKVWKEQPECSQRRHCCPIITAKSGHACHHVPPGFTVE